MKKHSFTKVKVMVLGSLMALSSQALAIELPKPETMHVQSSSQFDNMIAQLSIDVSGVPESNVKGIIGMLGYLGIQPTGTVKETNAEWCVFNDWRARDQRAQIARTYNTGRFSVGTTFGGKWYCCMK